MPNPDGSIKNTCANVEELVGRHAEALYSYALMRIGDNELAEDMVQEALLAALQSWENFAGDSSELTWLIGILRHKILDFFRQHRDWQQADDETWRTEYFDKRRHWKNKTTDWKTNPETLAENKEFWKVLSDCLKELSQIMAKAFVMRELEGMSTEQVCKHLEISQTNLWVRLHRARLQLRRCLELNWFA
jgi:RNA polymerase sigma-70 factor (TIGR02943 family)